MSRPQRSAAHLGPAPGYTPVTTVGARRLAGGAARPSRGSPAAAAARLGCIAPIPEVTRRCSDRRDGASPRCEAGKRLHGGGPGPESSRTAQRSPDLPSLPLRACPPRLSRSARAAGDPEALSLSGDSSAAGARRRLCLSRSPSPGLGARRSPPAPRPPPGRRAAAAVLLLLRRRLLLLMKPVVVFVLGGPGAGKGTQCARIVEVRAADPPPVVGGVGTGLRVPACCGAAAGSCRPPAGGSCFSLAKRVPLCLAAGPVSPVWSGLWSGLLSSLSPPPAPWRP